MNIIDVSEIKAGGKVSATMKDGTKVLDKRTIRQLPECEG